MKPSTKVIHKGQRPDKETGAVIPPVYLTSTYVQDAPGKFKGYDYTRAGNPNFTNIEETLAALENAKYATAFSSGLGATTGIIASLFKHGDTILTGNDLYGGTVRLLNKIFKKFGVSFQTVNTTIQEEVKNALQHKPKALLFETPSNPLLNISDIEAITRIAKQYNVITIVDNTFATPYFQNPINLGADIVFHSTTKYIGGHSDTIGGAVVTNNKTIKEKLDFTRMSIGLNPSPFDAWMISRGVKTLAVRMEKHEKNAIAIAEYLSSHKKIKKVLYPGLTACPKYQIAKKQMKGFGGIVSVEFDLNINDTKKLISSFEIFSLAESLGGIESLVNHPASMTHASISKNNRERNGLTDGLVRFSVGIEDIEDLIADLNKQLSLI